MFVREMGGFKDKLDRETGRGEFIAKTDNINTKVASIAARYLCIIMVLPIHDLLEQVHMNI